MCSLSVNQHDHFPPAPPHCKDTETEVSRGARPGGWESGCRPLIHTQPALRLSPPSALSGVSQRQSGLGPLTEVSLPTVASFYFERLIHPCFLRFAGKPGLRVILFC